MADRMPNNDEYNIAASRILDSSRDCIMWGTDKIWHQYITPSDRMPTEDSKIGYACIRLLAFAIPGYGSRSERLAPGNNYVGFALTKAELEQARKFLKDRGFSQIDEAVAPEEQIGGRKDYKVLKTKREISCIAKESDCSTGFKWDVQGNIITFIRQDADMSMADKLSAELLIKLDVSYEAVQLDGTSWERLEMASGQKMTLKDFTIAMGVFLKYGLVDKQAADAVMHNIDKIVSSGQDGGVGGPSKGGR